MKKVYIQPKAGVHTFQIKVDLLNEGLGVTSNPPGDGTDALSKGQNQGGSSMWENMDED